MSESHYNFADLFEAIVDTVPDRTALVVGDTRRTFAEVEDRVEPPRAQPARHGRRRRGDHVGIYAYNGPEWVEGMMALYKLRAVPVNINYRYVEAELKYICENADLVGLILQREFAPAGRRDPGRAPASCSTSSSRTTAAARASRGSTTRTTTTPSRPGAPGRDFPERSNDDIHMIYTGGTTGMPKGVMWRQEDIFYALCGGIDAYSHTRIESPTALRDKVAESGGPGVMMPAAPLMHGAGQVTTIRGLIHGDTTVLMSKFDAELVWRTAAREKVNTIGITGDAMARPLADKLEEIHDELDLSNLFALSSSAAIFSQSIKDQLMERLPNIAGGRLGRRDRDRHERHQGRARRARSSTVGRRR